MGPHGAGVFNRRAARLDLKKLMSSFGYNFKKYRYIFNTHIIFRLRPCIIFIVAHYRREQIFSDLTMANILYQILIQFFFLENSILFILVQVGNAQF